LTTSKGLLGLVVGQVGVIGAHRLPITDYRLPISN
jgi:hypothetical protein